MLMPELCAVIWDVDGTLVDTAELHFQAWLKLAGELDKRFSRSDFAATFGRRNPEILRAVFDRTYTDERVQELGDKKEEFYKARARGGVALLPGVRALLDDLHRAGFKQAIGSSAPRGNLDLILALTRTEAYFDAVVSMEDTQRGKPDPDVFLMAARKLGVRPDHCVVIEDAVAGVQAAKAGGMRCIAVSFVGHHSDLALGAAGADLVVRTLEAVTAATVEQLLHAA